MTTMAGYDGLSMGSRQTPLDILHLGDVNGVGSVAGNEGVLLNGNGLDFNGETMFNDMPQLFTPTYELEQFSTTFDDPLSYQSNLFNPFLEDNVDNSESLPVDLDNKLLGFGAPIHKTPLLDQTGQTWPRMSAELNGMFCVAEDVFEGDTAGRPLELTCYRRNLFQISGTIMLSRTGSHVLLDQVRRVGIYDLVATLTATESIEGKSTDIIAVPWKTGSANGASAEEKTGAVPADIPLDLSSNQETDSMFISIPIAWGRLQFKYATANNGRRKGLQQHYRIQITLSAKLEEDGQLVKIAEIQSNPIVVRGRSPKNFDSSKDVPLSERKAETGSRGRTASSVVSTPQWIEPALSQNSAKFYGSKGVQPQMETPNWGNTSPTVEHRSKKSNTASPMTQRRRPPVPQPQWKTEMDDFNQSGSKPPMGLSLSDEESSNSISINLPIVPPTGKRASRTSVTSPPDSADSLYEYFPLSLDDWMPPVDAIYRPHVVHHLRLPPEVVAQQVRTKPKRYFSAED